MAGKDKILFGVCSWLAGKLGIDTTIIRIAFVVGLFFFGSGIGLYLILWIVKILEEKN